MDGESESAKFEASQYLSLQELEGAMGSLLASYHHLMVNLRSATSFNISTDIVFVQYSYDAFM